MEIVAGSYEELLLGYRIVETKRGYKLESSFNDHSHSGAVRSIAVSCKGILASGSTDESIRLFNMRNRTELGALMHHEGTVTGLCYYSNKHMFSSSEDGTIGVWRTGSWECVRTLRGHRGAVLGLAVHPSGKLALSIGKDKTLRTWNLITGKAAYVTNMKQVCDMVRWGPDGDTYIVVCNNKVDIYSVETAQVTQSIQCDFHVSAVEFVQPRVLAVGGEGGSVELHDLDTQVRLLQLSTDTNRVKAMCCCTSPPDGSTSWLITVSSDGYVKLWSVDVEQGSWSTKLLAEVNSKFRLTCVALVVPRQQAETAPVGKAIKTESQDDEQQAQSEDDDQQAKSQDDQRQTQSPSSTDSTPPHHKDTVVHKRGKRKKKSAGDRETTSPTTKTDRETAPPATKKQKHKRK